TKVGTLPQDLVADVVRLQTLVRTVKLEPAQIANGSVELLDEVSKSKITGEEERYSHVDLDDFLANVQGSQAAYLAVRPIVVQRKPALAKQLDARFASVYSTLAPYKSGDGYVTYTTLKNADKLKLSRSINALAEPLSRVAAVVVTR